MKFNTLPGQIRLPGEIGPSQRRLNLPAPRPQPPAELPPWGSDEVVGIPRQLPFPDEVDDSPISLPNAVPYHIPMRLPTLPVAPEVDGWLLSRFN
jgi:hypothetical protein